MDVTFNSFELTSIDVNGKKFLKYFAKLLYNMDLDGLYDYYDFLDSINKNKNILKDHIDNSKVMLNIAEDICYNKLSLKIVFDRQYILIRIIDNIYYDFLLNFNNDNQFDNILNNFR